MNWVSRKLRHLPLEVIDGDRSAKYPKREEFCESGVPFLNSTNLVNDRLDLSEVNYISESKFEQIKKGRAQSADILMTTRGSIGKLAWVPIGFRGLINAQMLIIRTDQRTLDSRFFFYLLSSSDAQQMLRNFSSGAAQPQIPIRDLKEIEVSVPGIFEQRRIAAILSAYDDLIENNTRRIAILEEMTRRIYEEWFVHFRFPGHENVRMVESKLGLAPEGWMLRPLGAVVDEVRDSISPGAVAADMPYVGLEHIPRRSIALAEWGKAEDVQSTKLRFRERDILFGKIRPYFHKVAVAPVGGVASSDAIVIRPKSKQDFGLALAVVSSDAFVAHATQTSNGTKMPRANWSVLARYPVPTPPNELRTRFEDLMESVVSAVSNHVLRNRNLRTTRDFLLPKLISGELDVSQVSKPEAAAA